MAGGNVYKVRTELWIEDVNVGSFSDLNYRMDKNKLGIECSITLPIYGIGTEENKEWVVSDRVRQIYKDCSFNRGSLVKAYVWYEQPSEWGGAMEKILVFKGFISKPIKTGFPVVIPCEGLSYIFRFGRLSLKGKKSMPFEEVIQMAIPVCKEAFLKFRKEQGLADTLETEPDFMNLSWQEGGGNLQATSKPVAYNPFNEATPFRMLEQLMRSFNLYCTVLNDWNVHFGARIIDTDNVTAELRTDLNVLSRDLKVDDGQFVDYLIKLTGIDAKGQRIAIEYQTNNQWSATTKEQIQYYVGNARYNARGKRISAGGTGARKAEKGTEWGTNKKNPLKTDIEVVERYSTYSTEDGLKQDAESIAMSLRGLRHRGKIKLMLYPFLQLFDFVKFTDTQFPMLTDGYYVMGYTFSINPKSGVRQEIDVTNQKFLF